VDVLAAAIAARATGRAGSVSAGKSVDKEQVKSFWEQEACGERYGDDQDRLRYDHGAGVLELRRARRTTGGRRCR
jgi:hypothetical protein